MSEEKVETKTARTRQKKDGAQDKENPVTLVYCGPSLRDLQQYSAFIGEPPEHVKKHMENSSAVKELFVAPNDMARTRKRIEEIGTREHQLYVRVLEYARGGNH